MCDDANVEFFLPSKHILIAVVVDGVNASESDQNSSSNQRRRGRKDKLLAQFTVIPKKQTFQRRVKTSIGKMWRRKERMEQTDILHRVRSECRKR